RLIQRIARASMRVRNRLVPVLRISHHSAEPLNTPTTISSADSTSPLKSAAPIPAKALRNVSTVIGLTIVSATTDAYEPNRLRRASALPSWTTGGAVNVL